MLATTIQHSNTTPHHQSEATPHQSVLSQSPIVCRQPLLDRAQNPDPINVCCAPSRRHYSHRLLHGLTRTQCAGVIVVLLRKEVIQPPLPVRLPCYDFVPIADPTFDHSLPQGVRPWASGVTDFHDVTGGVYKARERIHRSVADLRLLATPTSRGRVADPDPN